MTTFCPVCHRRKATVTIADTQLRALARKAARLVDLSPKLLGQLADAKARVAEERAALVDHEAECEVAA